MRFSSGLHVPEIFRDGLHRPRDDFWERISTDKYFLHIFCPFGIRWNPFSGLTDPLAEHEKSFITSGPELGTCETELTTKFCLHVCPVVLSPVFCPTY